MTIRMNPAAMAHIQRLAENARNDVLHQIAADAREYAPVETGELRASIRVDESAGEVIVGVPHAIYVEMGTEHMTAQPYMRPALYKRRVIRGRDV